ncbi:hypothetical protein FHL15_000381 [Xylaria flabelliformis]|uniref:Fungal lipase-type domain-containing protein n=1 Tax=Xylaria flabelliformis TaxID=2512241 RepID=A0A553IFQ2_9PEZI|nr:hypothetical protein FHL15_000381 [Xylaria flabelliformis]
MTKSFTEQHSHSMQLRPHTLAIIALETLKSSAWMNFNPVWYGMTGRRAAPDDLRAQFTAQLEQLERKAMYERDIAVSTEQMKDADLKIEWSLASSANGNIKATTLTTFVAPPPYGSRAEPTTYLVIAVRGSASTVDQLVNLNGEARDASTLFIEKRLDKSRKFNILLTGHSAGGAVATLLHLALRVKFAGVFAKFVNKEDRDALDQAMAKAPVLNIINEYDLVPRLDAGYLRSLIRLYNSGNLSSNSEDTLTAEGTSGERWPLPAPDLQHIGPIVVLKTELPDLKLDSIKPPKVTTKITAWSISSESLSDLVFCQLGVHRRKYYQQKIEQLADYNDDSVLSRNFKTYSFEFEHLKTYKGPISTRVDTTQVVMKVRRNALLGLIRQPAAIREVHKSNQDACGGLSRHHGDDSDRVMPSFRSFVLVEETQYLARDVLPSGGVVVHDTGGCGQDDVAELTGGEELRDPFLHL